VTPCYAVLVDAAYLTIASGDLVLGTHARREFRVDGPGLVAMLMARADARLGGRRLRLYWYDAARDRVPTVEQRQLAALADVKVRLGNLNRSGQQKGVDALLRTDLEQLAAHRAISDAVLLSGDEDMLPAVEAAQGYGVRVHLWGVEPPFGSNQADRLVWESDTSGQIGRAELAPFLERVAPREPLTEPAGLRPPPPESGAEQPAAELPVAGDPVVVPSPALLAALPTRTGVVGDRAASRQEAGGPNRDLVHDVGEHVASRWLVERGKDNLADLLPGPMLPGVIDHELVVAAEKELGISLRPHEEARRWLRDGFWARLHREFGFTVGAAPR